MNNEDGKIYVAQRMSENSKDWDSWLRWLITIITGALALIVPLTNNVESSWWLCSSLILLSVSMVFLAIRLFFSHLTEFFHIMKMKNMVDNMGRGRVGPTYIPVLIFELEYVAYLLLLLGLGCLVTFACVNNQRGHADNTCRCAVSTQTDQTIIRQDR